MTSWSKRKHEFEKGLIMVLELFSRKRLNLTIFAHFPIFFHKKQSTKAGKSRTPCSRSLSVAGSFINNENFINLVKTNTCFTGKGSCIDLILTNRKYSFKNTSSTDTGLSDHHHCISSMMKTTIEKEEPDVFNIPGSRKFYFEQF